MDKDEFRRQIEAVADQTNPNRNAVTESLKRFSGEYVTLFLSLCADMLLEDLRSELHVMCLSAAKETMSSKLNVTIQMIRNKWFAPDNAEVAQKVKRAVTRHLSSENNAVRNLAAAMTALILYVEGEQWADLLPWLIQFLQNPQSSPVQRVGVITTFHEILILPIFNGVTNLPDSLVEFLRLLTVFLESSDVPLYFLKMSASCMLDMIRVCPSSFDDPNRIAAVLNVYSSVLPKADKELYITMHEVLIKIIKEFYHKIDCFMEQIFEIIVKGVKSSEREMSVISINVFRSLCTFERSLPPPKRKDFSLKTFELSVKTAIALLLATPPGATEQMDPGMVEEEALAILSEFYLYSPQEMIESAANFLENNLRSDNWVTVHASLYLLAGLCKSHDKEKKPLSYDLLKLSYSTVFDIASEHPVPRLVYESLFVMKRIVKLFIRFDESFDSVAVVVMCQKYLHGNNGPVLIMACQVLRALVVYHPKSFTGEFFKPIADSVIDSLRNELLDSNETLFHQIGLLQALVKQTPFSSLELVNQLLLGFVAPSINSIRSISESSGNRDQRLIYVLRLLSVILDRVTLIFFEEQIDGLFQCLTRCLAYRDHLLFSEVLAVLSITCQKLQRKLLRYAGPLLDIVHTGLVSQSPEMTKAALLLYGDVFCKVDGSSYGQPLDDIVHLMQFKNEVGFQPMIAPIVYCLARVFEFTQLDIPGEIADEMMSLANNQLSAQCLAPNTDSDTLKDNFGACFLVYKVYFNRMNEESVPLPRQLADAKKLLVAICSRCYKLKAWNTGALFSLCSFLHVLGKKFGAKIANELNNANVKRLLKEGEKSKNESLARECKETLTFVANVH